VWPRKNNLKEPSILVFACRVRTQEADDADWPPYKKEPDGHLYNQRAVPSFARDNLAFGL